MIIAMAMILGLLLDLLLGDPAWLTHPVVLIGRLIDKLEKALRKRFPETDRGERKAGTLLVILVLLIVAAGTTGICWLAWRIHPGLGMAVQIIWCWQAVAVKDLRVESMRVYHALTPDTDLPKARELVGWIVGRDTNVLDEKGVTKAAVETIAENFSDGVAAPLFYMAIGGAPLAMVYKAVNTMDSMLGYKNEKYLWFGRTAAKLDDAAGYLPARLAALLFIAGSGLCGFSAKGAYRIWKRDRRNHASPNAAQTESACAGALGIQLAGPAVYFGEVYDKPYIGDPDRPVEAEDIPRTNRIMYAASILGLLVFAACRAGITLLIW